MRKDFSDGKYDLSLFETNRIKGNVIEFPKIKVYKKSKKRSVNFFRLKVVAFALSVISLLAFTVFYHIQLTELTDKIRVQNLKLAEKQSTYTQLEVKYNRNFSSDVVEDYAKNKLNMRKIDPQQVEYIALHN